VLDALEAAGEDLTRAWAKRDPVGFMEAVARAEELHMRRLLSANSGKTVPSPKVDKPKEPEVSCWRWQ